MDKVASLAEEQKRKLFTETARKMNTTPAIIEKDFWVVWVLDKIFSDERLNKILLEIGPLASWLPYNSFEITPYAAQHFPKVFEKPKCSVNAIVAKRTFWEKATILHQEANRVQDKLLKTVVEFKKKFYPAAWAKFDDAKPGSLKLLPPSFRIEELRKDYKAMEHMIFDKYLEFDVIIDTLRILEEMIADELVNGEKQC
jgi:hypothetical protein